MKYKGLIILVVALITTALLSYNYMYKSHRDIGNEKAEFSLKSFELFEAFTENPSQANLQYINKTIAFTGSVNSIESDFFIIKPNIVCKPDSNLIINKLITGEKYTFKGRCIGFDDLFMEVKMDNVNLN